MIAFDLQCSNGHSFEVWFKDGKAYEEQKEKGIINCPICNDNDVSKIPSAFAIKSSSSTPPQQIMPKTLSDAEKFKAISEFVEKNFDNVGCNFAEEALKIHYGVAEPRNIRGTSTETEEKALKEEGISFFKFPLPPKANSNA